MANQPKDGGPAFPVSWQDGDGTMVADSGMSLRDWFAGQALAGMLADPECDPEDYEAAEAAYDFADAMLAARERTGG